MLLPISIDRRLEAVKLALTSLAVAMLLAACGAPGGGGFGPGAPAITGSTGNVKVAVLLPITSSGSTPAVAKALKQAAELALFDFDNPSVSLVPKDTKGTPDGARRSAERDPGRRRADHRPPLRRRSLWRSTGGPSVEYSDDCLFQ